MALYIHGKYNNTGVYLYIRACRDRSTLLVSYTHSFLILIRPHGDDLLVAGLFLTDYPPPHQLGEDPPVEDPRLCDPPGEPGWLSW